MEKDVSLMLICTEIGDFLDLSGFKTKDQAPRHIKPIADSAPTPMVINNVITLLCNA